MVTIKIPVINPTVAATESIDLDPAETDVRKLDVTVIGIARTITITIEKAGLTLGTPAAPGTVFHYLLVNKLNLSDENIQSVKLEFRIAKSWVTTAGIDANTVKLYRYTAQWDELSTTKLSEDTDYVYYSATSPGLSLFAISGQKTSEAAAEEQRRAEEEAARNATGNETGGLIKAPADLLGILFWLVVVFAILGGGFWAYKKYFVKEPYSYRKSK